MDALAPALTPATYAEDLSVQGFDGGGDERKKNRKFY